MRRRRFLKESRIYGKFDSNGNFVDAQGNIVDLKISDIGSQESKGTDSGEDEDASLEGENTLDDSNYQGEEISAEELIDELKNILDRAKNGDIIDDDAKDISGKVKNIDVNNMTNAQAKEISNLAKELSKYYPDMGKPGNGNKSGKGSKQSPSTSNQSNSQGSSDKQGDNSNNKGNQNPKGKDSQNSKGSQNGQQGNSSSGQQGSDGDNGGDGDSDNNSENSMRTPDPNKIYVDNKTNFHYKWNGKEFEKVD